MARKGKGIRLSEKHGVNPSLIVCTLCGKETGAIALLGKIGKGKEDKEAPKHICDGSICDACNKKLKDEKLRTFVDPTQGKYIQLFDSALTPEFLEKLGDKRYMFVSSEFIANMETQIKEASEGEHSS